MPFNRKKYDKKRTKKLRKFRNKFKRDKRCPECNSRDDLQFHHTDPSTKGPDISRMKNKKQIRQEIKKTVLLCKECHNRLHNPPKHPLKKRRPQTHLEPF